MSPFIVIPDKYGNFRAIFVRNISDISESNHDCTYITMTNGDVLETTESFDELLKMCEACYRKQ